MPNRICPSCNTVLGSHDQFFCTKCGNKLPEELVVRKNPARLIPYNFGEKDKLSAKVHDKYEKIQNSKTVLLAKKHAIWLFPLIFILVSFGTVLVLDKTGVYKGDFVGEYYQAYKAYYNKIPLPDFLKKQQVEVSDQPSSLKAGELLNLELSLESKVFNEENYLKYIPYDADLYAQISDLDGFNSSYVISGLTKEASVSSVSNYFKDEIALFTIKIQDREAYGVLLEPSDDNKAQELAENFNFPTWNVAKVGEMYAFSNDKQVLEEVKNSYNGISKNLTQNPDMVKALAKLPKSGQIMFVGLKQENVQNVLQNLVDNKKVNKEAAKYLESILSTKDLEFVVVNLR